MKDEIAALDEKYKECKADGIIKPKDYLDKDLIKSLFEGAKEAVERLTKYGDSFEKEKMNYAFLLRDNYEVLRMLLDAFILFDNVNIGNHQCSNAYICKQHPELEFDWKILETMRLLRNRVNYRGEKITLEQWNSVKIQFSVYIKSLQKLIKQRLEDMKK